MTSPISLQSTVAAIKEQVSADLSGEVIILSLRNGEYFGLNPVGARIWELAQERRAVRVIRDRLLEEFPDVDSETCTADLLAILTEMAEAELIEVAATADASLIAERMPR
jgi:hypothetical protein